MPREPEIIVESGGGAFELYTKYREQQREEEDARRDAHIAAQVQLLDGVEGEEYNRRRSLMDQGMSAEEVLASLRDNPEPDIYKLEGEDFLRERQRQTARRRRGW